MTQHQKLVNLLYSIFTQWRCRNRGKKAKVVKNNWTLSCGCATQFDLHFCWQLIPPNCW